MFFSLGHQPQQLAHRQPPCWLSAPSLLKLCLPLKGKAWHDQAVKDIRRNLSPPHLLAREAQNTTIPLPRAALTTAALIIIYTHKCSHCPLPLCWVRLSILTGSFPPFPFRSSPRMPNPPLRNPMSLSSSSLSARMGSSPKPANLAMVPRRGCHGGARGARHLLPTLHIKPRKVRFP